MTASESSFPDRVEVPAGVPVAGRVRVPSSKSVTNRYLNLALLAEARTELEWPLVAEDSEQFASALVTAGFRVERAAHRWTVTPPAAERRGSGTPAVEPVTLDCGAGGTMLRLLTGSLAALPGRWLLDGVPRLRERPIGPLVAALERLGATYDYLGRAGYPPVVVEGGTLVGGETVLDAGESSQYLSSLLLAALRAERPVEVTVEALTSAPYVDLTLEAAERFGGAIERLSAARFRVEPATLAAGRVRVEADYSAAAYPAAAALVSGGEVVLTGLHPASAQGDRQFLALLERVGGRFEWRGSELTVSGGSELAAVDADLSAVPDQVPTLAAVAPFARGTTRIRNVAHLRLKESDRLAVMARELGRLGATIRETDDGLEIEGTWSDDAPPSERVTVDPQDDHRIAMSLAVAGLRRPGVTIADPAVVAKSSPDFWSDFFALTATP